MAGFAWCAHAWSRQRQGGRGVTFAELIILTLVLLILASIASPRMGMVVRGLRLRGAAWQLAGDVRLARQRAIMTQQRFRICVPQKTSNCAITGLEAGQYSLEREIGDPGSQDWVSETGAATRFPADVTIDGGTVTFSPNGMASGSAYTLKNLIGHCMKLGPKIKREDVEYEVTVASTGRVTVDKLPCS